MNDDPILAALARLKTGQTAMRDEAAGFHDQVLNRLTALWRMIKALETRVEQIEVPGQ